MSLPSVPRGAHMLSKLERFEIFSKYARYQPEHSRSGSDRYQICVGLYDGGTLFSRDTMDLYLKFENWVRKTRRKDRDRISRPWRVWDALDQRILRGNYSTRKSALTAARRLNSPYERYFVKKVGEGLTR